MTIRRCHVTRPAVLAVSRAERRTRVVVALTTVMMVAELLVGTWTRSLSLVADGWHMATHAGALSLAALAYWFARTRTGEASFAFGTGKVHALSGFTNAIVLLLVAVAMLTEGIARLVHPEQVKFFEALPVAALGFVVNLASYFLLHPGEHAHDPDVNLRAAHLHVAADMLTSLTAIAALLGGRLFGWVFLDPVMAIVGSLLIVQWGIGLVRQSARQLLDVVPSPEIEHRIRVRLEAFGAVSDLHVWEIEPGRRGCVVSVVTDATPRVAEVRSAIAEVATIEHLTIELDHHPAESLASF